MFANKMMQANGFQVSSFRLLSHFTRKSILFHRLPSLSTVNSFHTSQRLMARSDQNSWDRKSDSKPRFAGRKQPVSDATIFQSMDGDIKEDNEKYQKGPSLLRRPSNRRSVREKDLDGFVDPRGARNKIREESSSFPIDSSSTPVYQRYGESLKSEETISTGTSKNVDESGRGSYERNDQKKPVRFSERERTPSTYDSASSLNQKSFSLKSDSSSTGHQENYGMKNNQHSEGQRNKVMEEEDSYEEEPPKRRERESRNPENRAIEIKERRTETSSKDSSEISWKRLDRRDEKNDERPLFSRRPEMHRGDNYRARSAAAAGSGGSSSRDSSFPPRRNDYRRENRGDGRGDRQRDYRSRSESFSGSDRKDRDRGGRYDRNDRNRLSSSSFSDRRDYQPRDYGTRDSRGNRRPSSISYSSNNDRYDQRDSSTYQQRRTWAGQQEYQQQQEEYRLEASSYTKDYDGDNLYGISSILAALTAGKRTKIDELLIQEGFSDEKNHKEKKDQKAIKKILSIIEEKKISKKEVSKHVLNIISENRPHQGFILRTKPFEYQSIKTLPVTSDDRYDFIYVCFYYFLLIFLSL
jgi:hypothetical protein